MYTKISEWLSEAETNERCSYPLSACLSTVSADGMPDARIVMIDKFEDGCFYFCTDARSKKAKDLELGKAALLFYWDTSERQLRVHGTVAQSEDSVAQGNFTTRPRKSQVTAWASQQSAELDSEDTLPRQYSEAEAQFAGKDEIPCPDTWVAYCLRASQVEFWQARAARLHQRELFVRADDGPWKQSLLQP